MTTTTPRRSTSLGWTWGCLLPVLGLASGEEAAPIPAMADGGDELALFSELPVVVSASRQQTTITRSPVPVSVLSDQDIAASGHYRIEEVLRFVPGIDVLRISRNQYAVGVRGFHGSFSDRTLTLIDGRNADSIVFGGSEFYRQPVALEDLDHIEVVRGPGGAAWGANAFNGVINLITKDPEDMLGLHATTTVSGFGDTFSSARWCETTGVWSWKLSASHEQHRSSSAALDDDSFADDDWGRKTATDNAVVWRPGADTTVRGGIGYSHIDSGTFELLGYQPDEDDRLRTLRAYTRIDQGLSSLASLRFGWYGSFFDSERAAVFDERSRENVLEAQIDWQGLPDHRVSIGGEWRQTNIRQTSDGQIPEVDLVGSPYAEQRYGAFLIDHWQFSERLSLEGQIRGDYYDGTGEDWAGRLALVCAVDAQQSHILRLAGARSYRTPLPALRDASTARPPFFVLVPSDGLDNEHVWALEAGYSGQLTNEFLVRADVYHQRYEDLIGFVYPTPTTAQAQNIDGADGRGAEVEVVWTPDVEWSAVRLRLSGWYAHNHLETDQTNQEIRAFAPAAHKAGLNARIPLPARLTFNLGYAYASSTTDADTPPTHVGVHHQCDAALAWGLPQNHGEVMIGVWDLFHESDDPVPATGTSLPHETPGRTFFIRGAVDF
jgi:outer membrane receptor protein involved in Fe transport